MVAFALAVAYLAVTLAVGFAVKKRRGKDTTTRQFFVADGAMPLFAVSTMLFGDLIAASTTTGTAGTAYSTGVAALWGIWGSSLGCIVFSAFLCRFFFKIRPTGVTTGPEAIGLRFNQKIRYLFLVFTLIPLLIIFSTQVTAASMYLSSMLGINGALATAVVSVLFLIMALLGITGIAEMNKVNAFVIFFGLSFSAIVCLNYVGGSDTLAATLPAGYFNPFANGISSALAQFIGGALGFSLSTTSIAIAFCSKSMKVARESHAIVAAISALFALAPTTIGLCAAASCGDIRPDTALYAMTNLVDPWLAGIAVMAVFAAIFSTGPWFLLSAAQLIVRELYLPLKRHRGKAVSEKRSLRVTRLSIVLILFGSVAISGTNVSLLNSLMSAAQIKAIATILLLFGLYWKRTTNRAGFAGLLTGGTLSTIWYMCGNPFGVQPLWIGALSSIVIIVVVSLHGSKTQISPDYLAYETRVRQQIECRQSVDDPA